MIMLGFVSEIDSGVFFGKTGKFRILFKSSGIWNFELSPMIMLCCVSEIDCGVFFGKTGKFRILEILIFHP